MNQTTTAPLIRILKIATCPNLSDSAKLGYQIGCNAESKIQLRVHSNSGSGYFSREFVERNVLKGVKLLNVENQLHDVATDEQLQRLVEVLRTDHNRPVCNILMFLLAAAGVVLEVLPVVPVTRQAWHRHRVRAQPLAA